MQKRLKTIIFSAVISLLGIFFIATPTYAAKFETGDYKLEKDVIIEEDLYINGKDVVINGIVDGDLFVTGETVTVNGTVTGDLVVIASNLNVAGNVYGNTISLSQTATYSGILGENLFALASNANYSAQTGEDVYALLGTASVLGSIGDDLRILGGQVTIDSLIKGDALVSAGTYTVDEEKVTGNVYNSEMLDKALKLENVDVKVDTNVEDFKFLKSLNLTTKLIGLVSMFLAGSLLINIMPVKTLNIKEKITGSTSEFIYSLLVGIAVFILIPLPLIILLISIVGTPLGILLFGLLMFVCIFGSLFVEIAFGEEILELFGKKNNNYYLSLLTGRMLSVLISFVPILRGFYSMIITATAMGAIVRMKFYAFKKPTVKTETKKISKK